MNKTQQKEKKAITELIRKHVIDHTAILFYKKINPLVTQHCHKL